MSNLESFEFPGLKKPKWLKFKKWHVVLLSSIALYVLSAYIKLSPSSVIVGDYAGECMGYCHNTYVITNSSIVIDRKSGMDTLPPIHKNIKGNFEQLKFSVPLRLLFRISGDFGYPDGHDQGGYILGFKLLGMSFSYNIDKGSEPWYFSNMTDIVIDRIHTINTQIPFK